MDSTHGSSQPAGIICSGCGGTILDRFYLNALDKMWHEDCLKCACCDCRLGEVGNTCYIKANLILCRRDYLRLFGNMGSCAACSKAIPAFELVMRANGNVYHLECFACHECNYRFCVGDRFYLWDNRILCEADHDEKFSLHAVNMPNGHPHLHPAGSDLFHNGTSFPLRRPVIVTGNHPLNCGSLDVGEPVEMTHARQSEA